MSNTSHERLEKALELVLLFYHVGEWDQSIQNKWRALVSEATEGRLNSVADQASTKVLCDVVRDVLEVR
jgi:hypothetical protein